VGLAKSIFLVKNLFDRTLAPAHSGLARSRHAFLTQLGSSH